MNNENQLNSNYVNALLVLENGKYFLGKAIGAHGVSCGELCFNTAMFGYQEAITDPSYAGQILVFSFPHIGNVGCNFEDSEAPKPILQGLVVGGRISSPTNQRHKLHLDEWLKENQVVGISEVTTRSLVQTIRTCGSLRACIAHVDKPIDRSMVDHFQQYIKMQAALDNKHVVKEITTANTYTWHELLWSPQKEPSKPPQKHGYHVVVIDYGVKRNILCSLVSLGCKVTVVSAKESLADIFSLEPNGIVLSNGPGDPRAVAEFALPTIQGLVDSKIPIMGICLGHQLLALNFNADIVKMPYGHHGTNHPVKDLQEQKILITSQNHEYQVKLSSLSNDLIPTHISLFDNSLEGIQVKGKAIFSVQFHPEASPGPHESFYLFQKFYQLMRTYAQTNKH